MGYMGNKQLIHTNKLADIITAELRIDFYNNDTKKVLHEF